MIDNNKPIFDYSELELKVIGFDLLEQIEACKKELTWIRKEMFRRSLKSDTKFNINLTNDRK